MKLIEEVQKEAIDSKSDLGTLLRKCKLLAARLKSKPLEDWLVWESNGYPDDVDVPSYRIWSLQVQGHFAGPFGSGIRNAPIPWACLPEKVRDTYENYKCRQSVASIEESLKRSKDGVLRISTGDLAIALGMKVYQHQNCIHAWAEFSAGNLIELLNTVRNRILDFALAVWKEAPTAGEEFGNMSDNIAPARVNQIFNTTVYGGAANVVGSTANSHVIFAIMAGDLESLEKALREKGMLKKDIEELRIAITTDERPQKSDSFGPRVSSWIGNMIKKAAEGSWAIGLETAGNLLAQAIARYYGL